VVFDCMVFLQAVTNEAGPAFACFRLVEEERLTLCLSPEVLAEVKDVLARPKLRQKFASLTVERVEEFLQAASAKAIVIDDVPQRFAYARDPGDEPYINLGIAAGARYLVSRDNDLLDLINVPEFLAQFPGLTIIDPVTLIRELNPPPPS
jgi:putative PIN family toxin of toxin-antitoxin system